MIKLLELFNQVSMWLAEWIIVVILLDDIYGLTNMRKAGKRMLRRNWKKFWKDTLHYHKVTK